MGTPINQGDGPIIKFDTAGPPTCAEYMKEGRIVRKGRKTVSRAQRAWATSTPYTFTLRRADDDGDFLVSRTLGH